MSSTSPSTVPSTEEAYTQLTSILHPPIDTPPSILEIDILPSTYPPQILYEHPALALPKSLLVQLYLHARSIFFDKDDARALQQISSSSCVNGDSIQITRLKATTVLLLFDPNHLTAANYRKRHILSLPTSKDTNENNNDNEATPTHPLPQRHKPTAHATQPHALHRELNLLTTLLTSPLFKHAKSPTLWSHRLWCYRHYYHVLFPTYTPVPASRWVDNHITPRRVFWDAELAVVLKAGERHARNYYAWEYARGLLGVLYPSPAHWELDCDSLSSITQENRRAVGMTALLLDTIPKIYSWCLLHPRDISGWSFLLFLMHYVHSPAFSSNPGTSAENETEQEEKATNEGVAEIKRVVWETEEWVRKYEWRGESVMWFLRGVQKLGIAPMMTAERQEEIERC